MINKNLLGSITIVDEELFYSQSVEEDTFSNVFDKHNNPVDKKDLERLAILLNSPWREGFDEIYSTTANRSDAYTRENTSKKEWQTTYYVMGYDGMEIQLFGYGDTPMDSFTDCMEKFKYLQKTYNPKNMHV